MRRTLQIQLDAQHGAEQPEFAQPLAALVGMYRYPHQSSTILPLLIEVRTVSREFSGLAIPSHPDSRHDAGRS
jgi:hypothetical protein